MCDCGAWEFNSKVWYPHYGEITQQGRNPKRFYPIDFDDQQELWEAEQRAMIQKGYQYDTANNRWLPKDSSFDQWEKETIQRRFGYKIEHLTNKCRFMGTREPESKQKKRGLDVFV